MTTRETMAALAAPFPVEAISWRVGNTNKKKGSDEPPTRGIALAYIDARDVMDRLDAIVGPENWRDEYQEVSGFLICKLWIKLDGEWTWKCDGAGKTDVEAEKGMVSDSFKRAAVKWGIGRYLYSLDSPWVTLNKFRQIDDSEMPKLMGLLRRKSGEVASPLAPMAAPAKADEVIVMTDEPPTKDAKVVALERAAAAMRAKPSISARAQTVKPKTQAGPTIGDSASVRAAILLALDFCQTRDHALAFSNNNGQKSDKWPLMSKADQDMVLKAVKAKFADISAKAKQKGAVA